MMRMRLKENGKGLFLLAMLLLLPAVWNVGDVRAAGSFGQDDVFVEAEEAFPDLFSDGSDLQGTEVTACFTGVTIPDGMTEDCISGEPTAEPEDLSEATGDDLTADIFESIPEDIFEESWNDFAGDNISQISEDILQDTLQDASEADSEIIPESFPDDTDVSVHEPIIEPQDPEVTMEDMASLADGEVFETRYIYLEIRMQIPLENGETVNALICPGWIPIEVEPYIEDQTVMTPEKKVMFVVGDQKSNETLPPLKLQVSWMINKATLSPVNYLFLYDDQEIIVEVPELTLELMTQEDYDFDIIPVYDTNPLIGRTYDQGSSAGGSSSSGNSSSDHPTVVSFLPAGYGSGSGSGSGGSGSGTGSGSGGSGSTGSGSVGSGGTTTGGTSGTKTPVSTHAPVIVASIKPKVALSVKGTLTMAPNSSCSSLKASGLIKGDAIQSWSSSNAGIVRVSRTGKLKALRTGSSIITVRTKLGAEAWVRVSVRKPTVKLNYRKLTLSLKKKKSGRLSPKNMLSIDRIVSWSTSNKYVAGVNGSGVVTARKNGTAWIMVKTRYGAAARCKVKVKK